MSGLSRPQKHANPSRLKNVFTHNANWIRGLLEHKLMYEVEVLETTTPQFLAEAEKFWIGYYRMIGANLTNLTDGGEGAPGYKQSPEHRQKIGLSNKGKGRRGGPRVPLSQSTKLKISQANSGKIRSPEVGASIAARQTGRQLSAATKLKMSKSHMGAKPTRGMTGMRHSDATKQKMSISRKRLIASREIEHG